MGAQSVGPEANPRTYNVTPRVPTSILKWNSASTALMAAEKMALAKEATNVEYVNIADIANLKRSVRWRWRGRQRTCVGMTNCEDAMDHLAH